MPSVLQKVLRRETPVRLRLQTSLILAVAVVLLAATGLLTARVREQVRIIGTVAAPQAAVAADLYFALSDMDAQVARLVLTAGVDELAAGRIDALGAYRERSHQVDADLQSSLTTATGAVERAVVLQLLDHLAVYRERVWQALTAGPAARGYFTQATNVLHLELLPTAERLRTASEDRLMRAYGSKQRTAAWAVGLAVGLGATLLLLLIALQVWLARRFRRLVNPALLAATVLTLGLVLPAIAVLTAQERRLGDARDQSLTPYLALSKARAISYDAAADTSRYLISSRLALYREDFTRKSDCLVDGGGCGLVDGLAGEPAVVDRWLAYRRDHERIAGLADAGRTAEATSALTGIRRGDAAFDFAYFDAAVQQIAAAHRQDFDTAVRGTSLLLTGWSVVPPVTLGLVLLLVPLGVRRRLAEYR
ncbi:hypothetical protein ACWKSP_31545 [Micromonosporaceae bacterium Da 78-11]